MALNNYNHRFIWKYLKSLYLYNPSELTPNTKKGAAQSLRWLYREHFLFQISPKFCIEVTYWLIRITRF